uniref:Uncharacterized protein n=1 Tax=Moniliophthora roreri TaxID=221103 RepID=A0A0W0G2D5_MONRR
MQEEMTPLPPFNNYELYDLPWQNEQEWREFEQTWLYDEEAWEREKARRREEWAQLPPSSPPPVSEESDIEDHQNNKENDTVLVTNGDFQNTRNVNSMPEHVNSSASGESKGKKTTYENDPNGKTKQIAARERHRMAQRRHWEKCRAEINRKQKERRQCAKQARAQADNP